MADIWCYPLKASQKMTVCRILDMFDPGDVGTIDGHDIDRPRNALAMGLQEHKDFGDLLMFLEHMPNEESDHRYMVKRFRDPEARGVPEGGDIIVLRQSPDRSVDMPSQRLLAIHRACVCILHLSAAGDYIEDVLHDYDEGKIRADGSAQVGNMIAMRLGLWNGFAVEAGG